MAIKFGTWTPSPSARPTPRHGSWCCPSGRRPSAPGGRFGRCTRWRPARNRPCSFKRSASPTGLSRSSWLSDWRERDGAPSLPGFRVPTPAERALQRESRPVVGRRAAVHGRVRWRDLAGGGGGVLGGGPGGGAGGGGGAGKREKNQTPPPAEEKGKRPEFTHPFKSLCVFFFCKKKK